ncbi:Uncharacterised protein [Chlamydia trachomatis]|nr:Uncharacterised protein [Chlamydia trachomatis]CRH94730.1 Uncharacterised protein [Chlamydia trachomatis]
MKRILSKLSVVISIIFMSVNLGSSIAYANSWQNDLTFEHSLTSMIFERSALKMLEGGGRSLPLAAFVNKKGGKCAWWWSW